MWLSLSIMTRTKRNPSTVSSDDKQEQRDLCFWLRLHPSQIMTPSPPSFRYIPDAAPTEEQPVSATHRGAKSCAGRPKTTNTAVCVGSGLSTSCVCEESVPPHRTPDLLLRTWCPSHYHSNACSWEGVVVVLMVAPH